MGLSYHPRGHASGLESSREAAWNLTIVYAYQLEFPIGTLGFYGVTPWLEITSSRIA